MTEKPVTIEFVVNGLQMAAGMLHAVWPLLSEQDRQLVLLSLSAFMDTLNIITIEAQASVLDPGGPPN